MGCSIYYSQTVAHLKISPNVDQAAVFALMFALGLL